MRILLLEDSDLMAACVVLALDGQGHDTFHASTIASAFEALNTRAFDMAMRDIEIGKELSFGLAHHLLDIGHRFFFTSARDPSLLPEAFAGILYLRKPYDMAHLSRVLKEMGTA